MSGPKTMQNILLNYYLISYMHILASVREHVSSFHNLSIVTATAK